MNKFNIIDRENWDRNEIFEMMSPCLFTMTVELDITNFLSQIKSGGYRFYPSITHIIARVANSMADYRYTSTSGEIGYYDRVDPLYTLMRNKSNHLFTHALTEFTEDFSAFYAAFEADRTLAESCDRLYCMGEPPDNALCISIAPNVRFKHISFAYPLTENSSYIPFVTGGKYVTEGGKVLMPVVTEFHHEINDGYHAAKFYEIMQEY